MQTKSNHSKAVTKMFERGSLSYPIASGANLPSQSYSETPRTDIPVLVSTFRVFQARTEPPGAMAPASTVTFRQSALEGYRPRILCIPDGVQKRTLAITADPQDALTSTCIKYGKLARFSWEPLQFQRYIQVRHHPASSF